MNTFQQIQQDNYNNNRLRTNNLTTPTTGQVRL